MNYNPLSVQARYVRRYGWRAWFARPEQRKETEARHAATLARLERAGHGRSEFARALGHVYGDGSNRKRDWR